MKPETDYIQDLRRRLARGELEAALRRGFGEVQVTGDDVFLETGRHVHRGRLQWESK